MAELLYNDLLSQLTPVERQNFEGVLGSKGWLGNYQDNPNALDVTGHQSYNKFLPIANAASQSKTLNKFNWDSLLGMGSADAAIPTDAERAAINNSGIMEAYRPNMRDISGEVGEYVNSLSGITNTDAAQTMNTGNKYANLADDAWANKQVIRTPGGEIVVDTESGQVAPDIAGFSRDEIQEQVTDQWRLPNTDWGPVRPTESLPERGKIDMFLQRFGAPPMTQVSAADKIANQQFMGQQGIGRDPQTGRMYGGDFAGKNAPGTSGWGSANFGEMAQKWDEEYGDMVYKTQKMRNKQARMKQRAADFAMQQEAQQQERIRNERAAASAANQMTQRDPTGAGASRSHMGNISQPNAQAVAQANAAAGMGGWGLARGGRVNYFDGGIAGLL
jgi:hypothetical protein